MNQFLEAAASRCSAIWANKLRSFLTVLGNIVAVTSIIAVVSLDPGDERLRHRRDRLGRRRRQLHDPAHAGRSARRPTRTACATIRGSRSSEAAAIRKFSDNVGAVAGAGQRRGARSPTAASRSTASQIQGVTRDYIYFSTFDVERGRLISPVEVDATGRSTVLGWDVADKLFGPVDPLDKIDHDRAACTSASSASARRRARSFGNSQDEFAIIPLGSFQKLFGVAHVRPAADGQAASRPSWSRRRWTTRRVALRDRAAAAAEASPTTSACSRPTRCSASTTRRPTASSRCSSASSRCRWSSAAS